MQGPVGLMSAAASQMLGAGLIIAETDPKRQELSRFYGADIVVDFARRSSETYFGTNRW